MFLPINKREAEQTSKMRGRPYFRSPAEPVKVASVAWIVSPPCNVQIKSAWMLINGTPRKTFSQTRELMVRTMGCNDVKSPLSWQFTPRLAHTGVHEWPDTPDCLTPASRCPGTLSNSCLPPAPTPDNPSADSVRITQTSIVSRLLLIVLLSVCEQQDYKHNKHGARIIIHPV